MNFLETAYIREDKIFHTGEAMLLAVTMKVTGKGRNSKDAEDLRKLMRDINLETKNEGKRT